MVRLPILVLLVVSFPAMAELPREHWEYMSGYQYEYADGCTVRWHDRSATFDVPTKCPPLSTERLNSDAIKSIEFAQARSKAKSFFEYYEEINPTKKQYTIEQAKADAKNLWRQA